MSKFVVILKPNDPKKCYLMTQRWLIPYVFDSITAAEKEAKKSKLKFKVVEL